MKISRTAWLILGIGLFVIAAVVLYVFYNGQMDKKQQAEEKVAAAEAVIPVLSSDVRDLEEELAQAEAELAQQEADMEQRQATLAELVNEISLLEDELNSLEDERAQAILQAIALLDETAAKFIASVESIEHSELLFEFADNSNLMVESITVTEPSPEVEGGITYNKTIFSIDVRGKEEDILTFINTTVMDDGFKTAFFEPVEITIPESLTDEQKDALKEAIRTELIGQAAQARLASLDTEDIVGFILESIKEVTGQGIEAQTVMAMAEMILGKIAGSIDNDYEGLLSGDLAEFIESHIADSIINKVTGPLAEEIAALIFPKGEEGYDYDGIVDLLGEDIAELLGEEIAGSTQGDIANILNGYISKLVEDKMLGSVADSIDEGLVEEMAAQEITELEMSSATMTINIYTYESYTIESEVE